MTLDDLEKEYPARYKVNKKNLRLVNLALDNLWAERCFEREVGFNRREGSCKFAALLCRSVFGGRIDGNYDHVFVRLNSGEILDINSNQSDVKRLGNKAYKNDMEVLRHPDYMDSFASCIPRVNRWVEWFENEASNTVDHKNIVIIGY